MSESGPLIGEPLALDLVNTRPVAGDLLTTPGHLRAWLGSQADRFTDAWDLRDAEFTAADLAAVRDLRERTARVLDHVRAGTRPPAADLEALNQAQRAAPAVGALSWNGEAITAARRRDGTPGSRLTTWLAEAVAGLLVNPDVAKIRQCEAADCVMLFLPAHPRRRWCSAARCGNRVRVARHYQRRKTV
ncbi:ABATE domain-containing protein [Spongiactinospora sp. TRM90649]|uniref:CGNR zinc finger domain-containing protein n=1 Tax=Spongiactinospora sp. TRM90649 TaxID=3031114 RepID=UPI0023F878CD|nr:ABATE domain-containing protein [Spongiactinospora sp. TRM90649]MDF5758659.1 ABATE domain-containing protein [Spongiactinospora sp. TRM90649]